MKKIQFVNLFKDLLKYNDYTLVFLKFKILKNSI